MFDQLQEKFDRAFQILKGHGSITEVNVGDTLKEVRKALLDADVDYKTAKEFTARVKEKALGRQVLTSLKPGQLLVKITHEELTSLMGEAAAELKLQACGHPHGWPAGGGENDAHGKVGETHSVQTRPQNAPRRL
jgi:signal recognition particle subunit SRP54